MSTASVLLLISTVIPFLGRPRGSRSPNFLNRSPTPRPPNVHLLQVSFLPTTIVAATMAKTSGTKTSGGKKEKVFHPQSRKAGQLVRTQIRKSRLVELSKERHKKQGSQGECEIIARLEL